MVQRSLVSLAALALFALAAPAEASPTERRAATSVHSAGKRDDAPTGQKKHVKGDVDDCPKEGRIRRGAGREVHTNDHGAMLERETRKPNVPDDTDDADDADADEPEVVAPRRMRAKAHKPAAPAHGKRHDADGDEPDEAPEAAEGDSARREPRARHNNGSTEPSTDARPARDPNEEAAHGGRAHGRAPASRSGKVADSREAHRREVDMDDVKGGLRRPSAARTLPDLPASIAVPNEPVSTPKAERPVTKTRRAPAKEAAPRAHERKDRKDANDRTERGQRRRRDVRPTQAEKGDV